MKEKTYTYKRYMRDGSVEERTGIVGARVRHGKTTKDNARKSGQTGAR
jgi:hypothetical protein